MIIGNLLDVGKEIYSTYEMCLKRNTLGTSAADEQPSIASQNANIPSSVISFPSNLFYWLVLQVTDCTGRRFNVQDGLNAGVGTKQGLC